MGKPVPEMSQEQVERFWSKVDVRGPDECWLWTDPPQRGGYGRFILKHDGRHRSVSAHRASYSLRYGPIPEGDGYHGVCVLHRCDVRLCVNPSHLFLGTTKENTQDASRKGRLHTGRHPAPERVVRGEDQHLARLTAAKVRAIRAASSRGVSRCELGRRYGVNSGTISYVVRRLSWKHV